ncbi:protein kinase domain protein [Zymoseptoria brevis]|uniref:Protein kinase domain protein n=1 Tax=Zymoseptoria brevis TaxID=1047168 RepID=A0A0F4G8U9_9PEZI|nr:protein kinase domain protein [Zymoseptoria brevis]
MSAWISRQARLCRAPTYYSSTCSLKRIRPSFLPRSHFHYTTMSAPSAAYGYIDGVEHLGGYKPGGYHPVHIDDRLDQRYRIVHKLGHGTFSTAWLAIDEKTSKYVAIKVGTADSDRTEAKILPRLAENDTHHFDLERTTPLLPVVLDCFDINGPNGTHPCLVTSPAQCSLRDAVEASGRGLFQLEVARSLAAQLVMVVSVVHSQGYAHGDLHLGNLLIQWPSSLNSLSVQQLYTRYGEPEKELVVRLDSEVAPTDPGVPSYAVPALWLGTESHEICLDDAKLILSDFGVAFRPADKSRFESYTPLILRPPEAFFEPAVPLTFASDIWSLGCVIFELLAHISLIDGFLDPQDEITAQQVELQGHMPPEWWAKWEKRSKWYDEEGQPLSPASDLWSWERRFEQWIQHPRRRRGMEVISDKERDALLSLLGRMLAWRPAERLDVKEVMETDWMKGWAFPAYRKACD